MVREKTEIEKSEAYQQEAARLREALHVIHGLDDITEMKRVAWATMRGEKHGHEFVPKYPDWWPKQPQS
jgi:hypothetical protein